MILQIESREMANGVTSLSFAGRICMGRDCQEVEWKVADLLKGDKKKIVFDLAKVTLMDSTGVGILATCFGRLKRAGGELRLAGVEGSVKDILAMTHLDRVMPVFQDVDSASKDF